MSRTFNLHNIDDIRALDGVTLGQAITITAIVTSIQAEVVEVTKLGEPQPKDVLGARHISLSIQNILTEET